MNVLVSAFACDPTKGSEPGIGYGWVYNLATSGYNVTCITSITGKKNIEAQTNLPPELKFVYLELPDWADKLYSKSTIGMYTHYLLWQWQAYKMAKEISTQKKIDVVHHVSWGNLQLGSFMHKLKIPFIFGPVGGGQYAPAMFASYFGHGWKNEKKRKLISSLLLRFNPACYKTIKKAKAVIVVNEETYMLAEKLGATRIEKALDIILPGNFAPDVRRSRKEEGPLKLLWIARLMPRKGIFLVLDVMKKISPDQQIVLTIVGDGELKQEVDRRIKADNLEKTVTAVGSVPYSAVKDYYEKNDAFFFTSLRDSGPSQLIEAMAYGLPVITIDIHGQRTIVSPDRGIKITTISVEQTINDLAEAIRMLAKNRALLETMSINAFDYAKKEVGSIKVKRIAERVY